MKLSARHGDAGAIPACVVASLCGVELKFSPVKGDGKAQATFWGAKLNLETDSGLLLTTPTAMARGICLSSPKGAQLVPAKGMSSFKLEEWLEWVDTTLITAVAAAIAGHGDLLEAAFNKLASSLRSNKLVGGELSLADVCVWGALCPVLASGGSEAAAPNAILSWFRTMGQLPGFKEGLDMVLGGAEAKTLAELAKSALPAGAIPRKVNLPEKGKRNVMITSALPYVNNVPHLGNIIGCVLSADVYARYCRSRGYNVIYICGTDEYGTATETKALEEKLTPRQICDKYHSIHAEIYDWFNIQFDQFGRTSTPVHTKIAQGMFNSILGEKLLFEDGMDQLFDDQAQKFLADRFVEGQCPKCAYPDARGDQCDGCGALLNPTDLINPRSKLTGTTPRIKQTQHMFLNLPELSPRLSAYIDKTSAVGGWSQNSCTITNSWVRDGLKPRCITRDLSWGVPVPLPHLSNKVLYVWFDAPIGYISITAAYTKEWEQWWRNNDDVELVQFMGKDNVPFHTVVFPSMQIGTGEKWTMMRTISTTEYLNYENDKFSKSRGIGVFGNDCKSTGVASEVWRYYLLVNRPESADTQFLWADFAAKNNNELLANLGNFCHRTLTFVASRFGGEAPQADPKDPKCVEMGAKVAALVQEYIGYLEKQKLKDGLRTAMQVSKVGNLFFQDNEPWVLLKSDKAKCASIIAGCLGLVKILAVLLEPYMPSVFEKLSAQLGAPEGMALSEAFVQGAAAPHLAVKAGHKTGKPETIFRNITDDELASLRFQFSGTQAENQSRQAMASSSGKGGGKGKDGKPAKGGADKGKDGKPAEKGNKKAPDADKPVDVSRLDIRVGQIRKVSRHPNADALYVEEIDVGEEKPRTVVSGLVKYIPEDKMQDRRVVVVCNMKPSAMRGVVSQAMVLAANNADHTAVELLEPPAASPIGERATVEGFPGEPDEQLNPKKKVFEAVQPDFQTSADCIAMYKGKPLCTPAGPCKVASIAGGGIK